MLLDLKEYGENGKVVIEREVRASIENEPVIAKIAGIGSAKGHEKLLGEIIIGQEMIKITNKHIVLLDSNRRIRKVFENRNIQNFIYADKVWVYALNNRRVGYNNKLGKQGGSIINPGLCVYDFSRLLEVIVQ